MAVRFALCSFMNGQVLMEDLPVDRGSDRTEINVIDGGFGEYELPWRDLPGTVRNSWATFFKPFTKIVAVVDDSLAWNHPQAVNFAGFVNKVDKDARSGVIRIQTAPINEYLAARAAAHVWDTPWMRDNSEEIAEADEPRYKAATWEELIRYLVGRCFAASPAGTRQPPSIIRSGTVATTTGDAVSIPDEVDGTTYLDLLTQIRDEESGNGMEWQFVPAWTDSSKTAIAFDLKVGSAATPHIGEGTTTTVELSATSEEKISTFTSSFDATEFYNKIYLRYQNITATETETANDYVRAAWAADNGDGVPLVDKFVLTNTQLTEAQVDALAQAHVIDGQTGGLEVGFSVEEEWDRSTWIARLGHRITFTGVPDSLSAGDNLTVRLIAIEFAAQLGTITATFMALLTKYPSTPQNYKKKKTYEPAKQIGWTNEDGQGKLVTPDGRTYYPSIKDQLLEEFPDVFSGGGGTPTTPVSNTTPTNPYAGADGVLTPDDLKGSEGYNPWEPPKTLVNPAFEDLKEIVVSPDTHEGVTLMSARNMIQTNTNRLYGMDHDVNGWGSRYSSAGVGVHYNGGVDAQTGLPLNVNTWRDIIIKKSYLKPDGGLGPIETVGKLPAATMMGLAPEYEWNESYAGGGYDLVGGYHLTNWWVGDRYYLGVASIIFSQQQTDYWDRPTGTGYYAYRPYYQNGRITIFSIATDTASGKFVGDWKKEPWTFDHDVLPLSHQITRYGTTVLFGAGIPCLQLKVKNLDRYQFEATYQRTVEGNATTYYGDDQAHRNGHASGWIGYGAPAVRNLTTGGETNTNAPVFDGYSAGAVHSTFFIKNFGDPNSKFEYFAPQFPGYTTPATDQKKFGGIMTNPIISNGAVITNGLRGVPNAFAINPDGMERNPKGYIFPNDTPASAYSSIGAPVNGGFFMQAFGYNNSDVPNKTTLYKFDATTGVFTHFRTETTEPYKNVYSTLMGVGGAMELTLARRPIAAPDGINGGDNSYHMYYSKIFSYGGRLYIIRNGGNTGRQALTVRSVKVKEQ